MSPPGCPQGERQRAPREGRPASRSLLAPARRFIPTGLVALGVALVAALAALPAGAAVPPAELLAQVRSLESLGRGQPLEAARRLEALLPDAVPRSPEALELLTVQGLVLAEGSRDDAALAVAARLEGWATQRADAASREAATAALLVRASSLAHGGNNFQRADAMLRVAAARLPEKLAPRQRYRLVAIDGYIKDQTGRVEEAVRLNHEALALADLQPEAWRRSEARTALSYSYVGAKQFDRAYRFSQEAISIAEAAQDSVSLGRAYNTAGIVLDGLGDPQGERRSFVLAIERAVEAGARADEVRYRANLADFYLKNSEFKTALEHAERALPLARELKDANSEMVALANIGLAKISMQQIEEGKRLVQEAIAIDERRGAIAGVADTYRELGGYLEKAGDLAGAVQAYHTYRKLAAKVSQKDQQQAVLAIQEQYDANRRASALAQLQREQVQKTDQLRHRSMLQRLWWAVAAVCLVSFGSVVLLYRRVRRTNALLVASNDSLRQLTERDPLTGLSNRRHFQTLMQQAGAGGCLEGSLLLIDIDHFKQINDRYGHATGDAVLQEVAHRLRQALRSEDLVVRWGGEEFLVLVRSVAPACIDAQARRLLEAIHGQPVAAGPHAVAISGSIGFASFPLGPGPLAVSWERALNLVDRAMYLAKAEGRNRACGVKLQHPGNGRSLESITRSLEAGGRNGDVALTWLRGSSETERAVAA